jgi:hypothetical protein
VGITHLEFSFLGGYEILTSGSIIDFQMEGSSGSPGPTTRKFKYEGMYHVILSMLILSRTNIRDQELLDL